jgi:3-hydroxy-9,10-secoandrosta-1,3,5(10)-triene-9,17-dione monooxygenase reductase component
VTIHTSDPFATPDDARSPVRRLRGRLPAGVTLWTGYGRDGRPTGLTVSSTMVIDGEPGYLLGALDEESDLYEAVRDSGRFAVMALRESDSRLADRFAGLLPAPGGPFVGQGWRQTPYGPVLDGVGVWAGCVLEQARPLGWSMLVEARLAEVELGPDGDAPLVHHRGRYVVMNRP